MSAIILAFATLFYTLARNRRVFEAFESFLGRFKIVRKYTAEFGEVQNSFSRFLGIGVVGKGWAMSIPIWLMEAVTVYLGFLALGIDFDFMHASIIYFTSLAAGALSFIPGGLVVTEGSMIGLLTTKGLMLSTAVALALLVRMSTLWFTAIVGIISAKILIASYHEK